MKWLTISVTLFIVVEACLVSRLDVTFLLVNPS